MSDQPLLLGLDFGGTKLAAGLVDPKKGEVIASERRATEPDGGAALALATMLTMARNLLPQAPDGVRGVGINFGGPVDAGAGIVLRSHQVPGWDDFPLASRVSQALGLRTSLENDANGQALAEWRFGAGRGSHAMAYLNIGTGIGGGVVLDGRLWRGAHGLAGEFGHMVIQPGGPLCRCGRSGCLEALASGPAMGGRARAALAALPSPVQLQNVMVKRAGGLDNVTGRELTAAAADGDALAVTVLDAIFGDLALGIVNVLNCIDPDLVVLGGGAADLAPSLFARLLVRVRSICLPGTEDAIVLCPAALGPDTGIFGGAAVLLQP
ncbi:MAG: ROK family protein [Chloroflexota bacterium]